MSIVSAKFMVVSRSSYGSKTFFFYVLFVQLSCHESSVSPKMILASCYPLSEQKDSLCPFCSALAPLVLLHRRQKEKPQGLDLQKRTWSVK
jgi:hypothetical protein